MSVLFAVKSRGRKARQQKNIASRYNKLLDGDRGISVGIVRADL